SAQIREILISESAWEEMTCLFAPSLTGIVMKYFKDDCFNGYSRKVIFARGCRWGYILWKSVVNIF
ncbi:hypothetical protein AAGO91_22110, partial [Klebsiella pneumoniae]